MSGTESDRDDGQFSDRNSADSDVEGGLNLPRPDKRAGSWLVQANKPETLRHDNGHKKRGAQWGAALKPEGELFPGSVDVGANTSSSDDEAETKPDKRNHTKVGKMTQIMLEQLSDRVFTFTQDEIAGGCSVLITDTDDEFNKKAARYDTQQAVKASTIIFKKFSEDMQKWGLTLKSVRRVFNAMSWSRYVSEREFQLNFRNKSKKLNECYLYHGAQNSILNSILNEGLDARLARRGRLGEGIYFTDSPLKAFMYACHYNIARNATILVCRVIVGESKQYAKGERRTDADQRREPLKEKIDGKLVYYDSVCGRPKDFKEYVVYQNSRVFIEYALEVTEDFNSLRRRVEKVFEQRDQPTVQMLVASRVTPTDYTYQSYNYAQRGQTGYTPGQMLVSNEEAPFSEGNSVRLEDVLRQRFKAQSQRNTTNKPDTSTAASESSQPQEKAEEPVPECNPGKLLSRFLPPPEMSLFSIRRNEEDRRDYSTSVRPGGDYPMAPVAPPNNNKDPDLKENRPINREFDEENEGNEEPVGDAEMPPDASDPEFMHNRLNEQILEQKQ